MISSCTVVRYAMLMIPYFYNRLCTELILGSQFVNNMLVVITFSITRRSLNYYILTTRACRKPASRPVHIVKLRSTQVMS